MPTRQKRDRYGGLDIRDVGAYTVPEAAHYVQVPENTLRAWCYGRSFKSRSTSTRQMPPLIEMADTKAGLLSFFNLLEAHVVRSLRCDHALHMQKIRDAIEMRRALYDTPHPLLDRRLETAGLRIFLQEIDHLVDLSHHGQIAIEEVFRAHLRRIEYDDAGLAAQFFPFRQRALAQLAKADPPRVIVVNPHIAFGRPVLVGTRIPSAELAERWDAGDSIAAIAADYDQPPEAIETAIRWERAA